MSIKVATTILIGTAALCVAGCGCNRANTTSMVDDDPYYVSSSAESPLIGPQGARGPAGAQGQTGPTGQSGPEGYAMAGPRGPAGPQGSVGQQGPAGATGRAGEVVRGPAGPTGVVGETGRTGQAGQMGQRGSSVAGPTGPVGAPGPEGRQGPAGPTGSRGETLVGPAGRVGEAGPTGERGEGGQTGAIGATSEGVVGAAGPAGPQGPAGRQGRIGPVGPTGVIERWAFYREFWFDQGAATIHGADRQLLENIAAYMRENPSLELGIDGSTSTRAMNSRDGDLRDNRIDAVRESLIAAGVPASRISEGRLGNPDLRRDGRVGVLLRTNRNALSQDAYANDFGTNDRYSTLQDWTSYQYFWFDADKSTIHSANRQQVDDIVSIMTEEPGLQLGIDSSLNSNDPNQREYDRELAKRRGAAVRDALIAAGVHPSRIAIGTFGDTRSRRDGRVEVLLKTDRYSSSR